jgi:hypothetical protein
VCVFEGLRNSALDVQLGTPVQDLCVLKKWWAMKCCLDFLGGIFSVLFKRAIRTLDGLSQSENMELFKKITVSKTKSTLRIFTL